MKMLPMSRKKIDEVLKPTSRRFWPCALFIAVNACLISTPSLAAEEEPSAWGLQLGAGIGSHRSRKVDLAVVWDPKLSWWDNGTWRFSTVLETHLAQWKILHRCDVTEVGVTPMFLYAKHIGSVQPYIEAGIGVRLLSRARMADSYTLSSTFQFADMIGIGATFGPSLRYKAGLRLQHLSNAGIKRPNPGINFVQTFIQYNF